jgi:predicted nuclease with TOPRIM domain
MGDYNFKYQSIDDMLNELWKEIEYLKQENIETTNTLYEIQNRLDSMEQSEYNLENFTLGDS